jgi:hypothetical protein
MFGLPLLVPGGASADVGLAIDMDGSNDSLTRASNLTGASDGKTFTASFWIWIDAYVSNAAIFEFNASGSLRFSVTLNASNQIAVGARDSTNTSILNANVTSPSPIALRTWNHVLISCDMANSSNRAIYINDVAATVNWGTYTNAQIAFSQATALGVGSTSGGSDKFDGRLAAAFLDYTYRDLSNSANRRLFITADRKPSNTIPGTAAILYLPLSNPASPGANAGTGGNLTLTGTVARSGRGPNQATVSYSDLDGSNDYLSRAALSGAVNAKTFTFSCWFATDSTGTQNLIWETNNAFVVQISSGALSITARNEAGTDILNFSPTALTLVRNRNYHLVISVDLSNSGRRHVYVNGQSVPGTWAVYTNDTIDFTPTQITIGASGSPAAYVDGRIGEVWFDTTYLDLSVASTLAKFVTGSGRTAKPVNLGATGNAPTGSSPLLYLPMVGSNAGRNLGTGGDFTVNSGPYTGARGPDEYQANLIRRASTGKLARTSALVGVATNKKLLLSMWGVMDADNSNNRTFFNSYNPGGSQNRGVHGTVNTSRFVRIFAFNASGTEILNGVGSTSVGSGLFHLLFSVDLTDTGKRAMYVNGVAQTVSWDTYSNDTISWDAVEWNILLEDAKVGDFFLTNDYLDISQEANRLRFRDPYGFPVDLGDRGTVPTGTQPLILLRGGPLAAASASFGTNAGAGGDFTVTSGITDFGQVAA